MSMILARYEAAVIDMEYDINKRTLGIPGGFEIEDVGDYKVRVINTSAVDFQYALTDGQKVFRTPSRRMFVTALLVYLQ